MFFFNFVFLSVFKKEIFFMIVNQFKTFFNVFILKVRTQLKSQSIESLSKAVQMRVDRFWFAPLI